jgi:hypothetical protein
MWRLVDELFPLRGELQKYYPALDQMITDASYACRERLGLATAIPRTVQ